MREQFWTWSWARASSFVAQCDRCNLRLWISAARPTRYKKGVWAFSGACWLLVAFFSPTTTSPRPHLSLLWHASPWKGEFRRLQKAQSSRLSATVLLHLHNTLAATSRLVLHDRVSKRPLRLHFRALGVSFISVVLAHRYLIHHLYRSATIMLFATRSGRSFSMSTGCVDLQLSLWIKVLRMSSAYPSSLRAVSTAPSSSLCATVGRWSPGFPTPWRSLTTTPSPARWLLSSTSSPAGSLSLRYTGTRPTRTTTLEPRIFLWNSFAAQSSARSGPASGTRKSSPSSASSLSSNHAWCLSHSPLAEACTSPKTSRRSPQGWACLWRTSVSASARTRS